MLGSYQEKGAASPIPKKRSFIIEKMWSLMIFIYSQYMQHFHSIVYIYYLCFKIWAQRSTT